MAHTQRLLKIVTLQQMCCSQSSCIVSRDRTGAWTRVLSQSMFVLTVSTSH